MGASLAYEPNQWQAPGLYRRLGLDPKVAATGGYGSGAALSAVVKRQFKKLALIFHPDKSRHPKAAEAFSRITQARDLLLQPV